MQTHEQRSVPNVKSYAIYRLYIYRIKFRMLQVRENEIAPRKLSAVTAQLRSCAPERKRCTSVIAHTYIHWVTEAAVE